MKIPTKSPAWLSSLGKYIPSKSSIKEFGSKKNNLIKVGAVLIASTLITYDQGIKGNYNQLEQFLNEKNEVVVDEIKFTENGFKQYKNNLLVRELEEEGIPHKDTISGFTYFIKNRTDHKYNEKGQRIRSDLSEVIYNKKTGKEFPAESTGFIIYEYNDNDSLKREDYYGDEFVSFEYKYNEKGQRIEKEKRYCNGQGFGSELTTYKRDKAGNIIDEKVLSGNKTKHIINGKDGKINTVDYDDDGLFDSAERAK